jgi:outer membrane protein assembly factor BamB
MRLVSSLCVFLAIGSSVFADETWPQVRGPRGDGHSDATGIPLTWSETKNVAWKTEIPGEGWSSPVVAGNQIWMTTATDEGRSLRAVMVDRTTGRVVHNVEIFHRDTPIEKHATNSFASPTPILDGQRVYVHFGTMGTACLDTRTAEVVWQNEELHWDHQVGPGASPTLFENLLLLNCDGTDVQFAAALDKRTGQVVWKTDRSGVIDKPKDQKKSFVTPLVIQVEGRDVAIMTGAEWVYAYDPRTGQELWNVKHPGFSVAPRSVYGHGLLFVCTGYMLPELYAIRPVGTGALPVENVVWKTDKSVPSKPSPLLIGDELYIISDSGIVTCFDAKTGKQHWRQRLGGNFSASPIYVEGRIYCQDEAGRTVVFAPGKKYEQLAENQLDGRFMASPAVAGKELYLRTDKHLYRIEE